MATLTVDLTDPDSIALAYQVLGLWGGSDDRGSERPAASTPRRSSDSASGGSGEDPWSSSGGERAKPQQARSERPSSNPDIPESGRFEVQAPNGFQVWEFGVDDKTLCDCRNPAAKVTGYKGKDSAVGKPWKAWRCALGYSKNTYKQKCEFSEWA